MSSRYEMRSVSRHAELVAALLAPVLMQREPQAPFAPRARCIEPLVARVNSPAFETSAMDGFAVRIADLVQAGSGAAFDVCNVIVAAIQEPSALEIGSVARVMTGAPVPVGADAVIPWERSSVADLPVTTAVAQVSFSTDVIESLVEGRHVKGVGEEFRAGVELMPAGSAFTPALLGLAATAGCATEVGAWRDEFEIWQQSSKGSEPLRVGVVVTGDELLAVGSKPEFGGVFESNSFMLASLFSQYSAVVEWARVGDDREACESALVNFSRTCDFIVTSGGVSQGAAEVVRDCLEMGRYDHPRVGTAEFVRVAMQPGSPQGLGTLDIIGRANVPVPVICMPGTPTGAFNAFQILVRPLLERWVRSDLGAVEPQPDTLFEPLRTQIAAPLERAVYDGPAFTVHARAVQMIRGIATFEGSNLVVREARGAHLLGLARANCLFEIAQGESAVLPGVQYPLVWLSH